MANPCHSDSASDSESMKAPKVIGLKKLPTWAKAASKKDNRSQPWKKHASDVDDPLFAQGEELSIYYKAGMTLCLGEGSLAA